jgi:DNA polymerase-3 subunit alpha
MGKKKVDVMEEQFDRFIEGCAKNGIDQGLAKGIWEKINKFAGYGFNKSHSAAYAFLSYRTAYLKANYPVEFMAAVMSSAQNKADELAALLNECRNMGIEVRPPAVNASGLRFSVDGDVIVFGLGAIKGVGSAAAEGVIEARREGGPFTDLLDFCERLVGKKVNRRVMESLCRAGAFDCLGHRRSETFAVLDEALSRAQGTAADKAAGQGLLFSIGLEYPELPEWPSQELLAYEKELLGFYVSGHPLAEYADEVRVFSTHGIADIAELAHEAPVRLAGVFSSVTLKRTKKDQREMAITLLEGLDGDAECLFFADAYDKVRDQVVPDRPVFIEGRVDAREDGKRLSGEKVIPMDQAGELLTRAVHVRLREGEVDERRLDELARLCEANPGSAELVLCAMCESGECVFIHSDGHGVANSKAFREGVEDLCGQGALRQKTVPVSVKPRRRPQNGQWRNSNGSNGDG